MNKLEGYAIEPGVSHGQSGFEREWPEEELRESVESLVGAPIAEDSSMATPEKAIGEVTDAEYVDGRGIWYEAEIWDDEAMQKIEESVELAPAMITEEVDLDEEPPYMARDIEFRSLFLAPAVTDNVPGVERVTTSFK